MLPPIYDILSGDAAVADIVAARIYPHGEAPQDTAAPYVTWFLVTGVPENGVSDAPDIDRCVVQIDCWHRTSYGIVALAAAVRDAIQPHAHITGILANGRDDETGLYRIALQTDYWLDR